MSDFTDDLHQQSDALCQEQEAVQRLWSKGFTRRRFIAGAGLVGAAAIGSQLVTSKGSFVCAGAVTRPNTLVVVFLRGAADGLRLLVPASADLGGDYLRRVRPHLVPAAADLRSLAGAPGWGLNKSFDPLLPYWGTGELSFVPGVSAPGVTRSHAQAQTLLENGGVAGSASGWLDRVLQGLGPGTTFRALADGASTPASLAGDQASVSLSSLANFTYSGWGQLAPQSQAAMLSLYRGFDGPLGEDVPNTFAALATAASSAALTPQNGAVYADDDFGRAMRDIARLLHNESGLQVATVDVGGWDTHTLEAADLDANAKAVSTSLAAFLQDLGPVRRSRVTVAVMTEFGRRVAENANAGTDHGRGGLMWLLGGGLAGAKVRGKWTPLSDATLDNGDVPMVNNAYDVLGEVAQKRLGMTGMSSVFPGHQFAALGLATSA